MGFRRKSFAAGLAEGIGSFRYQALADYNAECSRGIVHTPEYDEKMRLEQEAFNMLFDTETATEWPAPTPKP